MLRSAAVHAAASVQEQAATADVHVFTGPATAPRLPARDLQALLDARLAETSVEDIQPTWSPRRMIAFAVVASTALWGALGAGVYLALHAGR